MTISNRAHIAFFISPHGFGHASRACAVMNAIYQKYPSTIFHIFTTVPEWFFKDSLNNKFQYNYLKTDVGLEQKDPFTEDIKKTIDSLNSFIPFNKSIISNTSDYLLHNKCKLVLCDISALGLFIANNLKIPSILIENFTWSWIYEPFVQDFSEMKFFIDYFNKYLTLANYRIQTAPICYHVENADLHTSPISRSPLNPRSKIRNQLNIGEDNKMILITMGGIPSSIKLPEELTNNKKLDFVIPGNYQKKDRVSNKLYLPHHSNFYHPDLVNACDLIIAKAGYSTIAESYYAGIPFGYITRQNFRESSILEEFITKHIKSKIIHLTNNRLDLNIDDIEELLEKPITRKNEINGAQQISEFISNLVKL